MKSGTDSSELSCGQFAELAAVIVRKLPRELESGRAQYWIENQERLTRYLYMALSNTGTHFFVNVDYGKTTEQMIAEGHYREEVVDPDIKKIDFSTKRTGIAEIKIQIVYFCKKVTTPEVLKEFDRRSLRPAEFHELLALGNQYDELPIFYYEIVALGSSGQEPYYPFEKRMVPALVRINRSRSLITREFGSPAGIGWGDAFCFAAVEK